MTRPISARRAAPASNSAAAEASPTGRYLALAFPRLSAERLRSTRPHLFVGRAGNAVALVEQVRGAVRLAAVDHTAARLGLRPGLALAEARAQVPDLEVFPHDPHADLSWLERLAEGCARYTAGVALDPPDGLTLDITDGVHSFETEQQLAADLEQRMARRGILLRCAFGDTPHAARALARHTGAPAPDEARALRRLPVAALGLDEEDALSLTRTGLKTLGDAMALPAPTLAARFGESVAQAVRELQIDLSASIAHRRERAHAAERRLSEPTTCPNKLLAMLGDLAAETTAALEERREGGRRWEARLFRVHGEVHRLRIETAHPTRDVAALIRLFRERLVALADPLDPELGIDLIRLHVTLAERLDTSQLRLEGGRARVDGERHGADRPARARIAVRHRPPEQAELSLAVAERPATLAPEHGQSLRPIHLFDPPQPIRTVTADAPGDPPRRFHWRRNLHEIARIEGPERIAGDPWRRSGPDVAQRDYYRVEDRRGRRFWIFRHALGDTPRWYVHGLFA